MTFRTTLAALVRRELAGRAWPLAGWTAAGVGAAVLAARLRGPPIGLTASFAANFEVGLSLVLAALAVYRLVFRASGDHASGWIIDWCGSGGRRDRYILALGAAVLATALLTYAAGVMGYTLARVAAGTFDTAGRTAFESLRGAGRIVAITGYGLIFASFAARPGATFGIAIAVVMASPLLLLFIVVLGDLPDVPAWARYVYVHLPPINAANSNGLLVRQFLYAVLACVAAAGIANRRVGRVS